MAQPLDRTARIAHTGEIDVDNGEFWVENPFEMPAKGENLSAFERNRLYLNAGNNQFVNASFASACDIDSDSRTAVAFDFDDDGDEDILVGNVGGGSLRLFENNLSQQDTVKVRLRGTESNKSGIGSRVTFQIGDRKIVRDLFPANGFMGNGPAELVVGLGKAEKIDSISIRWPSGKTQSHENVATGKALTISEGESEIQMRDLSRTGK